MVKNPASDLLRKTTSCNSKVDCSMLPCGNREGYHGQYQINGCITKGGEYEDEMKGFSFGMDIQHNKIYENWSLLQVFIEIPFLLWPKFILARSSHIMKEFKKYI